MWGLSGVNRFVIVSSALECSLGGRWRLVVSATAREQCVEVWGDGCALIVSVRLVTCTMRPCERAQIQRVGAGFHDFFEILRAVKISSS